MPSARRSPGLPYRPLRGRNAFDRVYGQGVRRRKGGVVVVTAPGEPGVPQVGFVAGRRVGNAVERNRAKRRLRAAMAQIRLSDDTAYVVIADRTVVDVAYSRLVGWVEAAVTAGMQAAKEDERD
jgi:ribonuclease P protein component